MKQLGASPNRGDILWNILLQGVSKHGNWGDAGLENPRCLNHVTVKHWRTVAVVIAMMTAPTCDCRYPSSLTGSW